MFITILLSKLSKEAIQVPTTTFQYLAEEAQQSVEIQAPSAPLLPYTKGFEFVFAKDNFNILLEYHYWNHVTKLLFSSKPKFTKIYPLFSIEQKKLDAFLEENLHTK